MIVTPQHVGSAPGEVNKIGDHFYKTYQNKIEQKKKVFYPQIRASVSFTL
jgi:hypothetical protein